MRTVKKVGYRGPVGLQCYKVAGPSADHLRRSMHAWRAVVRQVSAKKP
jgi:hypothetical protein